MIVPSQAVIRADAGPNIGGGHVMRCMSLAAELNRLDWVTTLAMAEGGMPPADFQTLSPCRILSLLAAEAGQPEYLIEHAGGPCQIAIIDHYGLDATYEHELRGWASRIFVIDDLADRAHDCDFLLDSSIGRTAADYDGLVPDTCRLLLGPAYALVRSDFSNRRHTALARRSKTSEVAKLFVSFGLSDPTNATVRSLKGIAMTAMNAEVDVVLGEHAPHLTEVQELAKNLGRNLRVHVHVNPANLPDLMASADIALGAGGGTTWERCCLGLPTLAIPCADNQRQNLSDLARVGAAVTMNRDALPAEIAEALERLAADSDGRRLMANKAAGICDGRGIRRVGLALQPEPAKAGAVTLRPATLADTYRVFQWQKEPGARTYSRTPRSPAANEHQAWMRARLARFDGAFEIVEWNGEPAGFVRLDPVVTDNDGKADEYEVSILISKRHQGSGVGTAALRALRRLEPEAAFQADIRNDHTASQKIFLASGYVRAGDIYISDPNATSGAR